eukprot:COSAG01_NODE_269_length_19814_cov_109.983720_7_plen_57_part_00
MIFELLDTLLEILFFCRARRHNLGAPVAAEKNVLQREANFQTHRCCCIELAQGGLT